jgi:hypothetical protein
MEEFRLTGNENQETKSAKQKINNQVDGNWLLNIRSVNWSQITILDSSNSGRRLEGIIAGVKINTGSLGTTGRRTKRLEWHSLNKRKEINNQVDGNWLLNTRNLNLRRGVVWPSSKWYCILLYYIVAHGSRRQLPCCIYVWECSSVFIKPLEWTEVLFYQPLPQRSSVLYQLLQQWAAHIAGMENGNVHRICWESQKERDH